MRSDAWHASSDSTPPSRHLGNFIPHNQAMRFLYFLADTFIQTFGITQPTEKNRKQAAIFILTLLVLMVAGLVVAGVVIHSVMKQ